MKQVQIKKDRPVPKKRRGAAMVEMAVCFPIFMLMLLGIIEFGRALMVSQLLTAAAREACREAIIDGETNASVEAKIVDQVVNTTNCAAADVTIATVVTSQSSGTELDDISDAEKRDLIQIDITLPFSSISFTTGRFLSGQDLRGQCVMRKE